MKVSKQSISSQEDQLRTIDKDLINLFTAMQKRLTLKDNLAGETVSVADTGSANTEFTVSHSLGSVPAGFFLINIDSAGVVYDSGTAWTSSAVYLKCSAANAAVTVYLIKE